MAVLKLMCLIFAVIPAHIALVTSVYNSFEPSPYEYGIIQQAELRNNTHNLVLGWRQYGDRQIYRGVIKESYKFLGTISAEFRYPAWGSKNETITCVLALDQFSKDTGGFVNITSGGVGLNHVTLAFKSQINRGLKYVVEIYGK